MVYGTCDNSCYKHMWGYRHPRTCLRTRSDFAWSRAKKGVYAWGQICVRGPTVFQGYYKDEEQTRDILDAGIWHTGDIGLWLPGGRLKIIVRKKNIVKLAQVSPPVSAVPSLHLLRIAWPTCQHL